jgi:general secretion pathway protein C
MIRRMSTMTAIRSSLSSPRAFVAAYERYAAWLPKAVTVLLAIVLARMAADLIWALVPTPHAAWQPPPTSEPAASAAKTVDLNSIAAADLFGHYQPPAHPGAIVGPVKDTHLNLSLLGIFAWDEKNSRALIAAQGGEEKPYAIGDTVSSGVTLQSIFPDRVILARNGRLEALRLNKDHGEAGEGDTGDQSEEAPPPDEEADNEDMGNSPLADIRNELLTDPARAAQYIRVMPVNVGGGLNGYRIYPGPDRALFTTTGLRPGDVVTALNGVQLNDPARALQLLGDLAHTNDLTVVVDRGGTSQTIRVNLNQ